jgi:integrase
VKLMVLLAQRREKILGMRWADLDAECQVWTVPRDAGKAKGVPLAPLELPPAAVALIQAQRIVIDGKVVRVSPFIFPAARGPGYLRGMEGYKRALVARMPSLKAGKPPWRQHDLRRSARSMMSKVRVEVEVRKGHFLEKRIDPIVAEALLGHRIPGVRGVMIDPTSAPRWVKRWHCSRTTSRRSLARTWCLLRRRRDAGSPAGGSHRAHTSTNI